MTATEWFRGVPWDRDAFQRARTESAEQAVTEVARGFIEAVKHDPTRHETDDVYRVVRGQWIAVISRELVVVGHGCVGEDCAPETLEVEDKPKGRGPTSYDQLIEWIEDAGFAVLPSKGGHYGVFGPGGQRLATLNNTPSDHRSLKNDTAACRKALGIPLRRNR